MPLAQSKLTAQGQVSVPAEVRRRLGLGPGSVLAWDEDEGVVIVRRVGRYSSEDVHAAVFGTKAHPIRRRTLTELREGLRQAVRSRHARD